MRTIYPIPSEACEICGGGFESVMYDALIPKGKMESHWKNICERCFHNSGSKLGIGLGQKYNQNGRGEFERTKEDIDYNLTD